MLLSSAPDARRYVKAGKAIITLRSAKTGSHFTYKVSQVKEGGDKFFVSLLTGQDNESNYSYLGLMTANQFRTTAKSCATSQAPSVKAFGFFCDSVLRQERMPTALEVRHEGRCGACGRKLTTPESVDRGIGPECWSRMS